MSELERIAETAFASFYGADAVPIAGAMCLRAPSAPDVPMLNRVVGLGRNRDVTDADLDAIEQAMSDVSYYVALSPDADPTLDARLAQRGFDEGWGWMLFQRPPVPVPTPETALTVRKTSPADTEAWAAVVATAYGLPAELAAWIASTLTLPSWTGFLAWDGDAPVAAAALWPRETPATSGSRDPARASRQGRPGSAVRRPDRPRPGGRLLDARHGDRRAARRPAERLVSQHPAPRVRGAARRRPPAPPALPLISSSR